MGSSPVSYRLKRFSSSADPDFAAALLLYVRGIAGPIRTDSNQITFWLDTPAKGFRGLFYAFGFYVNEQLVAFAEACYFTHTELLIFDYIVIEESYRRNNIFFEFADQLRQYFESAHPNYRYVVAEVGYGPGEQFPSRNSQLITRLLKLQGFRIAKAPYFQPRLVLADAETEMRADLLLFTDDPVDRIQRDTYVRIVRTIYFDYYLPWMQATTDTGVAYRRHLDELLARVEAGLSRSHAIQLNGHNVVLQLPRGKSTPSLHRAISFPLQALCIIVILTAALLVLKSLFHLSDSSFTFVYFLALLSFMATAGVVSKDARVMFGQLAVLFKYVFYRREDNSKPSAIGKAKRGKRGLASPQTPPDEADQ